MKVTMPAAGAEVDNILISVIVCTYNHSETLKQTLTSLLAQTFPSEYYEIIVVDNNSTDNTAEAVAEFIRSSDKQIRYVKERKQGLSYARNKGAEVARGEIIAYTDDDVIADKGWLAGLYEIYEKDKSVACVGGKIEPIWQAPKPDWLPAELESYLAILDYGPEPIELKSKYPFGANFSVRREIFSKIGGFEVDLGRKGKTLLSVEEIEFCHRIEDSGGKLMYTPRALVHHIIPPERLTKKWFRQRLYWQAISQTIYHQIIQPKSKVYLTKDILKFSKSTLGTIARLVKARIVGSNSFIYDARLYYWIGRIWSTARLISSGSDFVKS